MVDHKKNLEKLKKLNKKLKAKQISKNCFELPEIKLTDEEVKKMQWGT